jgi:hypothetical protein
VLGTPEVCPGGVCAGTTDQHGYSVTLGPFSCFVPTDNLPLTGPFVFNDYAVFYSERYAWWTYDGDGSYANAFEESHYHGHLSVFVDMTTSDVGASQLGSVEATATSAPDRSVLFSDEFTPWGGFTPAIREDLDNDCGGSPAGSATVTGGPIVRRPSDPSVDPVKPGRAYVVSVTGAIGVPGLQANTVAALTDIVADEGVVVCDALIGAGAGGACVPFNSAGALQVNDLVLGTDVIFQVCVDNSGDGFCGNDDGLGGCADSMTFSHALNVAANSNPIEDLPAGFTAGCENNGGFNGYVVFMCTGVHVLEAFPVPNANVDPHLHTATLGTVNAVASGTAGYADGAGFCGTSDPGGADNTVPTVLKNYV